ncbi:RDD family protein [Nocardioides sp. LHG3406-4]|uniref:RDD family protein n=1 Tax=Nocardioides sp. LHG3406-4 TaxID=2804575 RepID=UPI003CF73FE3
MAGISADDAIGPPARLQPAGPVTALDHDGFLLVAMVYLTIAWWISGRAYGDHIMGIRVLDARGARPRLLRALARTVL